MDALMTTAMVEVNIRSICRLSVHNTALIPPWHMNKEINSKNGLDLQHLFGSTFCPKITNARSYISTLSAVVNCHGLAEQHKLYVISSGRWF